MNFNRNKAIITFIRTNKKDTRKIYWFLNKILILQLCDQDSIIFCRIKNILQKENVQSILKKDNLLTFHEMLRINYFIEKNLINVL